MSPLLIMLMLILAGGLGFAIALMFTSKPSTDMSKEDRAELKAHRKLISELTVKAGEHIALGDDFAYIVISEINSHRNELS